MDKLKTDIKYILNQSLDPIIHIDIVDKILLLMLRRYFAYYARNNSQEVNTRARINIQLGLCYMLRSCMSKIITHKSKSTSGIFSQTFECTLSLLKLCAEYIEPIQYISFNSELNYWWYIKEELCEEPHRMFLLPRIRTIQLLRKVLKEIKKEGL